MSAIKLTKAQFLDLLDEDGADEIDHGRWRHGHSTRYVVPYEGKFYAAWVQIHSDDGMQIYGDITLDEVRQVEKTITVWENVKP